MKYLSSIVLLTIMINAQEIFLDFNLGDTRAVVTDKFKNHIKNGDMYTDNNGQVYYDMAFDEYETYNVKVSFNAKYYDGNLYEFLLLMTPSDTSIFSQIESGREMISKIIFINVLRLLSVKYGYATNEEESIFGQRVEWQIKNLNIELIPLSYGLTIKYTDKHITDIIDSLKTETQKNKTISPSIF